MISNLHDTGNGNYLQKAQVEVLGASVDVCAGSTAATRIADTFSFSDSKEQNKIAETKVVQPPFSKGLHLVSKFVAWKLEIPRDLTDIHNDL